MFVFVHRHHQVAAMVTGQRHCNVGSGRFAVFNERVSALRWMKTQLSGTAAIHEQFGVTSFLYQ
jgi:hypothetical protein